MSPILFTEKPRGNRTGEAKRNARAGRKRNLGLNIGPSLGLPASETPGSAGRWWVLFNFYRTRKDRASKPVPPTFRTTI